MPTTQSASFCLVSNTYEENFVEILVKIPCYNLLEFAENAKFSNQNFRRLHFSVNLVIEWLLEALNTK